MENQEKPEISRLEIINRRKEKSILLARDGFLNWRWMVKGEGN